MNRKALIGWLLKNIFFPLLPTLIAGILRIFHSTEGIPQDLFEGSDVFFSMAMLCLLVYTDFQKILDQDTREILTQIFIGLLVLMLALFANSIITGADLDSTRISLINTIKDFLVNNIAYDETLMKAQLSQQDVIAVREHVLSLASYIIAIIVILVSIFTKWKFDPWKNEAHP